MRNTSIVAQLRTKRDELYQELRKIDDAIMVLDGRGRSKLGGSGDSRKVFEVAKPQTRHPVFLARIPKICTVCDRPFKAKKSSAKYCTKECRWAAGSTNPEAIKNRKAEVKAMQKGTTLITGDPLKAGA